jgi:hypothetical protein
MSLNINQFNDPLQAQSEEVERFTVFRFQHSLNDE